MELSIQAYESGELMPTVEQAKLFNKLKRGHKWVNCGILFGYPQCCITYFVTARGRELGKIKYSHKQNKTNHSGFIPCPNCCKKILNNEKSLTQLINDTGTRDVEQFGEFKELWL